MQLAADKIWQRDSGTPWSRLGGLLLAAMGVDIALARGSVVFTIGRDAGGGDLLMVAEKTISSIKRLREMSPL